MRMIYIMSLYSSPMTLAKPLYRQYILVCIYKSTAIELNQINYQCTCSPPLQHWFIFKIFHTFNDHFLRPADAQNPPTVVFSLYEHKQT